MTEVLRLLVRPVVMVLSRVERAALASISRWALSILPTT